MADRANPIPPSGIGYDPDRDLRWQPAPQTMGELPSVARARLSQGEPARAGNDRGSVFVPHPAPPLIR